MKSASCGLSKLHIYRSYSSKAPMCGSVPRAVFLFVFISFFAFPAFAQQPGEVVEVQRGYPEAVSVAAVSVSESTAADRGGYYLTDGNESTGWGLAEGQETGWAELDLGEGTLISGMEIGGYFAPADEMVIEYFSRDMWTAFTCGRLKGEAILQAPNPAFIDLSVDRAVTNKIRIRLTTNSRSLVNGIRVIGVRAARVLHKAVPESMDASDNISPFYPARNIIDGNTYTGVRTIVPPLIEEILEKLLAFLTEHKIVEGLTLPSLDRNAEMVFHLKPGTSVSEVRLYFQADAQGDVAIETAGESGWIQAAVIPQGSASGWKTVRLTSDDSHAIYTDAVRLSLTSAEYGIGGVAECEIWGYGGLEGSYRQWLAGTENKLLDGEVNLEFIVDPAASVGKTKLEFLCEGALSANLSVTLNGRSYSLSPAAVSGGNTIYRMQLPEETEAGESSYLRFGPLSKPADSGYALLLGARLAEDPRDGEASTSRSWEALYAGQKNGAQDIEISLGQQTLLRDVEIWSRGYSSTQVFARQNGAWAQLQNQGGGTYCSEYAPFGDPVITDTLLLRTDGLGNLTGVRALGSPVTDAAPVVGFVWPKDGEEIGLLDNLRFVIGYVDNTAADVRVNGERVTKIGHFFWINLLQLDALLRDSLTIEARATDEKGRETIKSISIHREAGSFITVDIPEETQYTAQSAITVSGEVSSRFVEVTVNGASVPVSQRRYSASVPLQEGLNLITVQGRNRLTKETRFLTRKIVRYSGDLVLSINSPGAGLTTWHNSIVVSGTVQGLGKVFVSVNGVQAEAQGTRFVSQPVTLSPGENLLHVTATDQSGRQRASTVKVYFDNEPPVITAMVPEDNAIRNSGIVDVKVTVTDASPIWVSVNGKACTRTGYDYSVQLALADGVHLLQLTAGDAAGNTLQKSYTLIVDTTPPMEFVVSANPSGWTNNTQPVLSFEAQDAASGISHYLLAVDGAEYAPAASPNTLPPLSDGIHTVRVKAVDRAGWEREAQTIVSIDTIAPNVPSSFKVIPGSHKAILEWAKPDEDVVSYTIERQPSWGEGTRSIQNTGMADDGLTDGQTYSYRVSATDRASNTSAHTVWIAMESGVERELLNSTGPTVGEYDGATVYFPLLESMPADTRLEIRQSEAETEKQTAMNPIVSPVLEIRLVDANGDQVMEAETLAGDYIAAIKYDPALIPQGKSEEDLGVYCYDPLWDRWFLLQNSIVATDEDTVYFSSGHFSLYTVQATQVKDLEPEDYKEAGYSPFKTYANHGSITVSQQSGAARNVVTELVLPGPAGSDLTISRRYDTATALNDSRINVDPELLPYLKNQGDFTYSMGKGWRLQLPYIKNANTCEMLCLPDGSLYSFWDMKLDYDGQSVSTHWLFGIHWGEADESAVLTLTPREKEDFTLTAKRVKRSGPRRFESDSYTLTMKDGTVYQMDKTGRCTRITDPTGLNSISIYYKTDNDHRYQIDHMADAIGRIVNFVYTINNGLPYISQISIKDDTPARDRQIVYIQDSSGLLTSVTDAGSRAWSYDYQTMTLGGLPYHVPFDYEAASKKLGENDPNSKLGKILEKYGKKPTTALYDAKLLNVLRGPGKGVIQVTYGQEGQDRTGFTVVRQISVYPTLDSYTHGIPQRLTSYTYTMASHVIPNKDGSAVPENKRGYMNITLEQDGIRDTVYTYESYLAEINRWAFKTDHCGPLKDEAGISEAAGEDRFAVCNRIKTVQRKDAISGTVLETVESEYETGNDRSRPIKETVRHGSNFLETAYTYDAYGNRTSVTERMKTGARENRTIKKTAYAGGAGMDGDPLWKQYATTGFAETALSRPRHDLVLAEMTVNSLPLDQGGNAIDGLGTDLCKYAYYEYNTLGQATGTAEWDSQRNAWLISRFEYDNARFGNLAKKTDAAGHETLFEYDDYGYMSRQTEKSVHDADGNAADIVTRFGYERMSGWLWWTKNPRGFVTENQYDKLGRVTTITHPAESDDPNYVPGGGITRSGNPVTTIVYGDTAGNLFAEQTDPELCRIRYAFDDLGQFVKIIKYQRIPPMESVTEIGYDRWGNIASIKDPNENITSYLYDPLGRRQKIIYPLDPATEASNSFKLMQFDYASNLLTITDERGKVRTELHDMKDKVIEATSYNGAEEIKTRRYYDGLGNEIAVIGPKDGAMAVKRYDSRDNLVHVLMSRESFYESGALTQDTPEAWYEYNETGVKTKDILGAEGGERRITAFGVDELGRTIKIFQLNESGGSTTQLTYSKKYYDGNGNALKEVDANNTLLPPMMQKFTSYSYSARDKKLTETDRAGNVTRFAYNKDDNLLSVTGPRQTSGNYPEMDFTLVCYYDDLKRLVRAELPKKEEAGDKPLVLFEYDAHGNLLKKTEPDGGVTAYEYTPRNKVRKETIRGGGKEYMTAYVYDRAGNRVEILDKRGYTTYQSYDDLNRLAQVKHPLGNTESYQYDKDNNRITVTDGNGNTTVFEFDLFKRQRKTKTPMAANPALTDYDRLGNVTRSVDAQGRTRYFFYDKLNRLVEERDELGHSRVYTYDNVGNRLTSTDPNGTSASYEYTSDYRVKRIAMGNPSGKSRTVEYDYDEEGAVRFKSDSGVLSLYNGFDPEDSSAYRPDPYNRIKRERTVVDGKSLGVSYSYDLMDRITGVTYPNTRTVDYSYNSIGELAGVSGYLLEAPLYNKGLLEKLVAANGVESVFSYDENGRAKSIQSAKDGASVNSYSFTYDNADNIIRRNDDAFEYDNENRLKGSYLKGSFPADVKEGSQSVGAVREDLFGRKQLEFSLEEVLEDVSIIEFDYAAGSIGVDLKDEYPVSRIELVPQAGANRVSPAAVRVFTSSSNFPNEYTELSGFTASYVEIDGVSVLRILLNSAVSARYIKVKTDFDDREKTQFLPVNKAGFKNAPDKIIRVYYKVASRNEQFEHDEVGNRTRQQVTLSGTSDRGYKYYPGCNRLMTDGKYAYQYDANGNMVKKGSVILIGGTATKVEEAPAGYWDSLTGTEASITGLAFSATGDITGGVYWEYEYDLSNRLTRVRRNGQERALYAYNEAGLMVRKTAGGTSTYYSWSPNGKLLYAETGSTGMQYVWVNGKLFAYEKGASDGSGTPTRMYTHVDQVGSVTAITDNSGALSWKNEFTPYGELADGDRAAPDGVQMYAGHFWDEEAGLYYSNARWYDPTTGRFVSEDPARDGQNWYVYCKANPMGFMDPKGLKALYVPPYSLMNNWFTIGKWQVPAPWQYEELVDGHYIGKEGCLVTFMANYLTTITGKFVSPLDFVNANTKYFDTAGNLDVGRWAHDHGFFYDYWTLEHQGEKSFADKINDVLNNHPTDYGIYGKMQVWTAEGWVGHIIGIIGISEDGQWVQISPTSINDKAVTRCIKNGEVMIKGKEIWVPVKVFDKMVVLSPLKDYKPPEPKTRSSDYYDPGNPADKKEQPTPPPELPKGDGTSSFDYYWP